MQVQQSTVTKVKHLPESLEVSNPNASSPLSYLKGFLC